ncbi:recombinase family protein [Sulfobacillus thermosulfidooxidans]|uniref:recombinase family protein n=1 Tax=Sulfobacillus thermosulfidooxidans TaxID=28034 RepID=UPI0006B5870B|nr:recombinase family protein [Sulfobacillus thermosulfidooxidans]
MLIGYARISTPDQVLAVQEDALTAVGCEKIFHDVQSGRVADRPGLHAALDYARPGDVLVVWKLDRLGRSLSHLIALVEELHERHIGLRSVQEHMDTTTAEGQLIFHLFAALAEFERGLIRERTMAGLAAARARGRLGGRPRRLTPDQVRMAAEMITSGHMTTVEVARAFHVSRQTVYRALKAMSDRESKMASQGS